MTNAEAYIAAMRTGHDGLAVLVAKLSDDDLGRPSGAAEWTIAKVLNHLGSGAEIGLARAQAALDGKPGPGRDFSLSVWDRWNAMSPREGVDEFLASNLAVTELYESMDADTRENLRIDLGFMPAPVDVATATRLRLNEFTLHSWDVRVGFDDAATLAPDATGALVDAPADLIGWISKTEPLNGTHAVIHVTATGPSSVFALRLGDEVSLDHDVSAQPDGTLTLPAEAWLRLLAGRLTPRHTPSGVSTTGAVDLDLLRRVFPGY